MNISILGHTVTECPATPAILPGGRMTLSFHNEHGQSVVVTLTPEEVDQVVKVATGPRKMGRPRDPVGDWHVLALSMMDGVRIKTKEFVIELCKHRGIRYKGNSKRQNTAYASGQRVLLRLVEEGLAKAIRTSSAVVFYERTEAGATFLENYEKH